jgi:hypothetical protein
MPTGVSSPIMAPDGEEWIEMDPSSGVGVGVGVGAMLTLSTFSPEYTVKYTLLSSPIQQSVTTLALTLVLTDITAKRETIIIAAIPIETAFNLLFVFISFFPFSPPNLFTLHYITLYVRF